MKKIRVIDRLTGIVIALPTLLALSAALAMAYQNNGTTANALTPQQQHGRDIWFNSAFGGEQFFSLILPQPPFSLSLGIPQALRRIVTPGSWLYSAHHRQHSVNIAASAWANHLASGLSGSSVLESRSGNPAQQLMP